MYDQVLGTTWQDVTFASLRQASARMHAYIDACVCVCVCVCACMCAYVQAAAVGSARRTIYDNWRTLDLPAQPNTGDNGVHASASPFEALAERANWLKTPIDKDFYGRGNCLCTACGHIRRSICVCNLYAWMYTGLMAAGVPLSAITSWCDDPLVTCNGKKGSLFDHLEDLDADVVLLKAQNIV